MCKLCTRWLACMLVWVRVECVVVLVYGARAVSYMRGWLGDF